MLFVQILFLQSGKVFMENCASGSKCAEHWKVGQLSKAKCVCVYKVKSIHSSIVSEGALRVNRL